MLYKSSKKSHAIAVSDVVKKQLVQMYELPEDRITVVHNGVNTNDFQRLATSERADFRTSLQISEEQTVLLFVSHEFRRKNLKTVLESLALLKGEDYILLVVGKDSPQAFEKMAADLGIASQVKFLGLRSDLKQIFGSADIFTFPTTHDAFGLVITEAMASSLPVITTTEAGAAELIEDGVDGVLLKNIYDEYELKNAILKLAQQQDREAMGAKALIKAEKYSWEQVVDRIIGVYDKVSKT
jgi:UDP-glucose:(heptosyl)LPS alpha-1,3-glucosyltransferase